MSDLEYLKGVGPKTLSLLNKLNIYTIEDLITHYPYKYEVLKRSNIYELKDEDKIIIDGIVETTPIVYRFKGNMNKMQFNINTGTHVLKVVIFNRLNDKMAVKIVEKNINILKNTLAKKDIQLKTTKRCIEYLKEKGITKEYGAREIARLIDREIKPMLVDEILFGSLKKDGKCTIDYVDKKLIIKK